MEEIRPREEESIRSDSMCGNSTEELTVTDRDKSSTGNCDGTDIDATGISQEKACPREDSIQVESREIDDREEGITGGVGSDTDNDASGFQQEIEGPVELTNGEEPAISDGCELIRIQVELVCRPPPGELTGYVRNLPIGVTASNTDLNATGTGGIHFCTDFDARPSVEAEGGLALLADKTINEAIIKEVFTNGAIKEKSDLLTDSFANLFRRRNPKRVASSRVLQANLKPDMVVRARKGSITKPREDRIKGPPIPLIPLINCPKMVTKKRSCSKQKVNNKQKSWGRTEIAKIIDQSRKDTKSPVQILKFKLKREGQQQVERDLESTLTQEVYSDNVQAVGPESSNRNLHRSDLVDPGSSPDSVVYNPVVCELNTVPSHDLLLHQSLLVCDDESLNKGNNNNNVKSTKEGELERSMLNSLNVEKSKVSDEAKLPLTQSTESNSNGISLMENRDKADGQPTTGPRVAWVCCDDCHKWRCIPAELADVIDETNCRWTCKDNADKAFADCSIPQEKSNTEINAELELSDASGDEGPAKLGHNLGDIKHFGPQMKPRSACPGKKASQPAAWTHIKTNLFLHRNRRTQTIDEIMVCNCKLVRDGGSGCGDQCLNRVLSIECVKGTCPCGDLCSNQQFQRRNYAKLKWFKCGKKGYGLQLQDDVKSGQFLIEYVGEVLDMVSYESRQKYYASIGQKHFYFMTLDGGEVIDACAKGNLGRFINHSCEPNCRTEKWIVNGEVCIGLFAMRDIKKGEELTFDYNYVRVFGAAAKKCFCGSHLCRGYIGGDPSSPDLVVQANSDDEDEEYFHPVTKQFDLNLNSNLNLNFTKQFDLNLNSNLNSNLNMKSNLNSNLSLNGLFPVAARSERDEEIHAQMDERQIDLCVVPTNGEDLCETMHNLEYGQVDRGDLCKGLTDETTVVLDRTEELSRDNNLIPLDNSIFNFNSDPDHDDLFKSEPEEEATRTPVHVSRAGYDTDTESIPVHVSRPVDDTDTEPIPVHASRPGYDTDMEPVPVAGPGELLPLQNLNQDLPQLCNEVRRDEIKPDDIVVVRSEIPSRKDLAVLNDTRKVSVDTGGPHFEGVEDKLNKLLDRDGGISRRKDATKGYLKLLIVTAGAGDSGTSQRLRDLSLILDALLKTKSHTVLVDIINKNGLQMLHTILKQNRDNFNRIPIIRKLLKVLEFLAVKGILTSEHMNRGPPCMGMESFRESIFKLTKHINKKVHQIARDFFNKWIRPFCGNFARESESISCASNQETPNRKRKTLDSNFQTLNSETSKKKIHYENSNLLDDEAPPGFGNTSGQTCQWNFGQTLTPCQFITGFPQDIYLPQTSVSYGIPVNIVQNLGTIVPNEWGMLSWQIAPSIPFYPFPPLPLNLNSNDSKGINANCSNSVSSGGAYIEFHNGGERKRWFRDYPRRKPFAKRWGENSNINNINNNDSSNNNSKFDRCWSPWPREGGNFKGRNPSRSKSPNL